MSNLVDEINKLNKAKKKEPRELKKFTRRIQRNAEISQMKRNMERTYLSIIQSIQDIRKTKKEKQSFESACYKSYDEFLDMVQNSSGKYGVETFETHLGPGSIIFTKGYGPFVKAPIGNNEYSYSQSYLYEGFAQNISGFFKYYNLKIDKIAYPFSPDIVITLVNGFALDPKDNSLEVISETLESQNHFVEEYYTLMEKTTSVTEKGKE